MRPGQRKKVYEANESARRMISNGVPYTVNTSSDFRDALEDVGRQSVMEHYKTKCGLGDFIASVAYAELRREICGDGDSRKVHRKLSTARRRDSPTLALGGFSPYELGR